MSLLLGKDLIIKKQVSSNYVAVVGSAKSCTIKTDAETIETTSSTHGGWRTYLAGLKSWSISVGYLVTDGQITNDLLTVGTTVIIQCRDTTDTYLSGHAIVKTCNLVGTVGNVATGTLELVGNGALQSVTPSS